MNEIEVWKGLKYQNYDYSKNYQVSNLGRIRSIDRIIEYSTGVKKYHKGKVLTASKFGDGYLGVGLSIAGKKKVNCPIHRAVIESFVRPITEDECVIHLKKTDNNNLCNLSITSRRDSWDFYHSSKNRDLPRGVSKTFYGRFTSIIFFEGENLYLGSYKTSKLASEIYEFISLQLSKSNIDKEVIYNKVNNFRSEKELPLIKI